MWNITVRNTDGTTATKLERYRTKGTSVDETGTVTMGGVELNNPAPGPFSAAQSPSILTGGASVPVNSPITGSGVPSLS